MKNKRFDSRLVMRAVTDSFRNLHPRQQMKNPIMFVVFVGAAATFVLFVASFFGGSRVPDVFTLSVFLWLLATLLFANFAEAFAEGRGRAQADALRKSRKTIMAKLVRENMAERAEGPVASEEIPSAALKKGDIVLVEAGGIIPADGEVISGAASVDESAITGESAPVIRESGGDRCSVTGGTKVLSDRLIIRVSADPGESFLDRMIAMVEGSARRKTPNEIALSILLVALTIIFLIVSASLFPFSVFAVAEKGKGVPVTITALIALLVCIAPTTIGSLLSAIGIAGMNRLSKANVIATSGRAVEAAGDVDILLMDKTGTITLGNRRAVAFIPVPGVPEEELADAAQLSSLADETPEGRTIVVLAKERYGLRGRNLDGQRVEILPFSARSRMSGIDIGKRRVRKGAFEAVKAFLLESGGSVPEEAENTARSIAESGGTPLGVADGKKILGVIHLKDTLKGGIRERFREFRGTGIKTVMITGDNAFTAAAIAAEAGVDDFLAEATPEKKLQMIRHYQEKGHMVAMTGDGTNDAPALAQADVAVAMNSGTQAAKEAGNMVDLDSDPTKLLEVVKVGKQLLMTRGALTTFSIANDVAKYFAIIPSVFVATFPALGALNIMRLSTPESAIISALAFNAIIIVLLIPLALRGVAYRPLPASRLLRRNLLIYGIGGLIVPFIGIKLIDILLTGRVY